MIDSVSSLTQNPDKTLLLLRSIVICDQFPTETQHNTYHWIYTTCVSYKLFTLKRCFQREQY